MENKEVESSDRFDVQVNEQEIEGTVYELLGNTFNELFGGDEEWCWSMERLDISSITIDEDLKPRQNAAIEERSRAIARAQLKVGEARPLIVVGEDNKLVDGHSHLRYLKEELGDDVAVVYKATKQSHS